MLAGDWCKFPNRERALAMRQMEAGPSHSLQDRPTARPSHTDEQIKWFMFGGYD